MLRQLSFSFILIAFLLQSLAPVLFTQGAQYSPPTLDEFAHQHHGAAQHEQSNKQEGPHCPLCFIGSTYKPDISPSAEVAITFVLLLFSFSFYLLGEHFVYRKDTIKPPRAPPFFS